VAKKKKKVTKKKVTKKKTRRTRAAGEDGAPAIPGDVLRDIGSIRTEWRALVRMGRAGNYARAKYCSILHERMGDNEKHFHGLMVGMLEEHSKRSQALLRHVGYYREFSSEALWKAIDMDCLKALANSPLSSHQRQAAARALVTRARRHGGVIPSGHLASAMAEVGVRKTPVRGPSKAELQRDMLISQIQEAVHNELLSRGLLRQIFSEDALLLLDIDGRRRARAAAAAPVPAGAGVV